MATGADVVAEARTWLGTPFKWQQSAKGLGCDCKGLVAGVARELRLPEADSLYASVSNYRRAVPVALLREGLAATFERVGEPRPGDVLLMRVADSAQHLAIFAGTTVIHTYARGHLARRVIEVDARVALASWPLDSAWRFGSLEG